MCFGGGGSSAPVQPPPSTSNNPAPPGSDAFQRFQEIRKGLLTGSTQVIDPGSASDRLGTTKGTQVVAQT